MIVPGETPTAASNTHRRQKSNHATFAKKMAQKLRLKSQGTGATYPFGSMSMANRAHAPRRPAVRNPAGRTLATRRRRTEQPSKALPPSPTTCQSAGNARPHTSTPRPNPRRSSDIARPTRLSHLNYAMRVCLPVDPKKRGRRMCKLEKREVADQQIGAIVGHRSGWR